MLAVSAIGAIWSSCSPEFGDDAICDRFGQIEPSVLITPHRPVITPRQYVRIDKVLRVLPRLASLKHLIVIGSNEELPVIREQVASAPTAGLMPWSVTVRNFNSNDSPFHNLCTYSIHQYDGIPKCIVHGAGGTLLQHLKEHLLHCDIQPNDTLFYYTTTGMMMWNWLVSGLAAGASVVCTTARASAGGFSAMNLAASVGITHFGASPRYYVTLEKNGYRRRSCVLGDCVAFLSTGSPFCRNRLIGSTKPLAHRLTSHPSQVERTLSPVSLLAIQQLPVYRGEIQCKALA